MKGQFVRNWLGIKKRTEKLSFPQHFLCGLFLVSDHIEILSGDVVLFELGCYALSRVDLWLFLNHPESRGVVVSELTGEFVSLFADAFASGSGDDPSVSREAIFEVLKCRENGYSRLVRERGTPEGLVGSNLLDPNCALHFLRDLIAQSLRVDSPIRYDFSEVKLGTTINDLEIRAHLLAMESKVIPELIKIVENYCDQNSAR